MIYIVTSSFGNRFNSAVSRLYRQIKELKNEFQFVVVNDSYIENNLKHDNLIYDGIVEKGFENQPGYGFYRWKPIIINHIYSRLEEQDTLIYLDAGTEISKFGIENFKLLIQESKTKGSLLFRLEDKNIISDYTAANVCEYFLKSGFNFNSKRKMVAAGILFFQKNKENSNLLDQWEKYARYNNGFLFKGSENEIHRHDQSILSILIQFYNLNVTNYPIWFSYKQYESSLNPLSYPIHTLRNDSNTSIIEIIYKYHRFRINSVKRLISLQKILLFERALIKFKRVLHIYFTTWSTHFETEIEKLERIHEKYYTFGDERRNGIFHSKKPNLFGLGEYIISKDGTLKRLDNGIYYFDQYQNFGNVTLYSRIKEFIKINFFHANERFGNDEICLLGKHDNNVYHFIYEHLVRALIIKRFYNKNIKVIIKGDQSWKFELLTLYQIPFRVTKSQILKGEFPTVSTPLTGCIDKNLIQFLQININDKLTFNNQYIYISRSKSKSRKITNESYLFEMLSSFGFKYIILENLSVKEQTKIFKEAKVVIAAHGAGNSWIYNCAPNTLFIEVFSPHYINYCFKNIASVLDLDYNDILGDSDFNEGNFNDPDIFLDNLSIQKIRNLIEERL